MFGHFTGIFRGNLAIAVRGIPVQIEAEDLPHIGHSEVADANPLDQAAPGSGGLDAEPAGGAVVTAVVNVDVPDAAGGLGSQGDAGAQAQVAVVDLDILTDPVYPQAVRVTAGFHADAVVVAGDAAAADDGSVTGIDVDTVGAGAFVLPDRDVFYQKIFTVTQMDVPEGGSFRYETADRNMLGLIDDQIAGRLHPQGAAMGRGL